MKKRSIAGVIVFPLITLGIYSLYWFVSTKRELNEKGAEIPTAWLLIIPLVNIYWLWKYYEGASKVTNEKVNSVLMFVIHLLVTSLISTAICQDAYNNLLSADTQSSPVATPPVQAQEQNNETDAVPPANPVV